ncbi:MAG: hypothetical protein U9P38_00590 [Campylobacterota bacterium]|nr:hypothetical protein [Campylobacterota bacterium]
MIKEHFTLVLKEDIASGKVQIDIDSFETTEEFGETPTEEQVSAREEKADLIVEKFQNSSASNTFTMLESSAKKEQLDSVTITEDSLRTGLDAGLAEIKYGIIESFVKIGLPVHDGQGNIIVYLPIEESRKGELPGKIYQLQYSSSIDNETTIESIGDDFTIRVINPNSDLNRVNGTEDWYREYLEGNDIVIPASVIDAFIVAKDHTTTMEMLGKAISEALGKDANLDSFSDTGIYDTTMNDSVQTSVENLVDVFKDEFLKQNFAQLLWESTDDIFNSFDENTDKDSLIADILALPFIVQGDEDSTALLDRVGESSDSMKLVTDQIGASLSNGIPVSDENPSILQFKTGTTITATSTMKPLASLAMLNLFMSAQSDSITFIKQPLTDMFGWVLDGTESDTTDFETAQIWSLDFNETGTTEDPNSVLKVLMETITGNSNILVERSFDNMVETFRSTLERIETTSDDNFGFEMKFKNDTIDFEEDIETANITLKLNNFNDETIRLDENETLMIAPIFVNKDNYEWKTCTDLNISLTLNSADKYEATGFNVYNPQSRFTEDGTPSEEGQFVSNSDFDLILVKADGTLTPIATFPIFPDENDLARPFFYDKSIEYAQLPAMDSVEDMFEEGIIPPYTMFNEHNYLTASGDVFFPQITKTDGEDIGENILSYDIETKTFSKNLTNGVVSNADMTITMIYKDYDDDGSTPTTIETIELNEDIKEGAFLQLKLSGTQIKTQIINMNIIYIGDNGEVEYELYKDDIPTYIDMDQDSFYNPFGDNDPAVEPPYSDTLEFTQDMLVGHQLYLATMPLNSEEEPYLSEVEFFDNGIRSWTKDDETSYADYAIVDGNLEIYNEDGDLWVRIDIIDEKEDGLAVELFDDTDTKIADRIIFTSLDDREEFVTNSIKGSSSNFDMKYATFDEKACSIVNGYNVISDSSYDPNATSDDDNGIEISSKYAYTSDLEATKIYIFYPTLTQELLNQTTNVFSDNYRFGFNNAWVANDNKTVYVRLAKDDAGNYGCHRYELDSLTGSIQSTKVYR